MALQLFYVDDDEDDLEFFQEVTQEMGLRPVLFSMGKELLDVMNSPPPIPSAVFIDLNMPLISGFEVLIKIRGNNEYENLPVVVLSTASDSDTIKKAYELGATFYMVKQSSYAQFKSCLEKVVAKDWQTRVSSIDDFVISP